MFDFLFFWSIIPRVLKYLHLTIGMAVLSFIFAILLGLLIEAIIRNKIKVLEPLAKFYILFFRSTPLLVQLFILYYGIPQIIPAFSAMNAFEATVIGISLNNAAYLAEVFRGAVNSVDMSQLDACLSIGLTKWQGMRRVILPQAARVALPSLGNTFIAIIKETSLGFTLGLTEMMAQAKLIAAETFLFFESFLAVAVVYLIIAVCFGILQVKAEKMLSKPFS